MDSFVKIPVHKDQIEIELEKLVPFSRYPIKNFQGQRLRNMINEIGVHEPIDIVDEQIVGGEVVGIKIISPIIVRPTADGLYEILDGHYRVAAVRQLKAMLKLQSVKVSAIIKEDLTDEEALSFISENNPIGLYLKHGIDIFCDDYRQTDAYKRLEDSLFFSDENSPMTLDKYIEYFLLDEHYVFDLYESPYNLGNPYELSEEECRNEAVACEIIRQTSFCNENDIDAESVGVLRAFARKDSGYIQQLKKYLNLDLDTYDYGNIQNQRERAKLLFFVHMLKKEVFPSVNILQLLSRASMENIDNSFLGWETSNGKYVKFVKHEVEKELSLTQKTNISQAVSFVVNTWGDYIYSLCQDVASALDVGDDCSKYIESLMSRMQANFVYQKPTNYTFSPPTPLGTFYLRLIQGEYLGQLYDIMKVLKNTSTSDYFIPADYVQKMRAFQSNHMSREDIEEFFKPQNVRKIAKYVYLRDETSEDRRRIQNSKEKVFRFLDFCKLADPLGMYNMMEDVTELLIISCLQSILLDSGNEIFDYSFHGSEGKKGDRKGHIHVQAALKKDNHTYDALKVYWVRRVMDRSYANVGESNIRKATVEIEKRCIETLSQVLNSTTIEEMLAMSSFYLDRSED